MDVVSERRGRDMVRARSGGVCEVQVRCRGARATEWHHRVNRSQGGTWCPSNGLHACSACHGWITDHPGTAGGLGLHVLPGVDPATVPVRAPLYGGALVFYDPDGCLRFAAAA